MSQVMHVLMTNTLRPMLSNCQNGTFERTMIICEYITTGNKSA